MLPEELGGVVTFGLLSLSIGTVWARIPQAGLLTRRGVWIVPFLLSLGVGLGAGFVTPVALPLIVFFGLACWLYSHDNSARAIRWSTGTVIILLSAAFMAHLFPGFEYYTAIPETTLSPDAMRYIRNINYDKPLIGLFLLAFCHRLLTEQHDWRRMLRAAVAWSFTTAVCVLGLALAIHYVRLDPKFPPQFFIWAWSNLFFTCIPEEALFRGFVQQHLENNFTKIRFGRLFALVTASLLFGLAHFKGGVSYVVLTTVAGAGYGFVYQKTKSIESSILVHFAVNTLHFLFFTYPALRY